MRKLLYILLPIMVLAACKKDKSRDALIGTYSGEYIYFSGLDTTTTYGTTTYDVSIDENSDDGLIFKKASTGTTFKVKIYDEVKFSGDANCSPRGNFKSDSLYMTIGCFSMPSFSGTTYKLKKQ